MSDYVIKYQHVERWDTDEVLYLKDCKELIVQPKLDGTNGVVTYVKEYDELVVGSRNRVLSVNNDNQGFAQYIEENREKYLKYFRKHPDDILYGEFLINHIFRVKPEYHNTFYVFDRYDTKINKYIPIDVTALAECGIRFVPSKVISNENVEETVKSFNSNFGKFLLEDSFEYGEGYVIKNYDAVNKYGRQVWAKILNEKPSIQGKDLFSEIRNKFFTDAWIEKETIKYVEKFPVEFTETLEPTEKFIYDKYCNILISEFIKEEVANIVFKFKYPKISFQELKVFLTKILKDSLKKRNYERE